MCRVISWVVGKGCLLWPLCSLDKTLLAWALLHFVLQGQTCLLFWDLLNSSFCIPVPYDEKDFFFLLVLEGLVGHHRTDQLKLLWHQWLGHRLGLLWCWMVCLWNELRSFCHFWDCTRVLHFWLLLTMRAIPFLLWDSCPQVDIMVICMKFALSCPF